MALDVTSILKTLVTKPPGVEAGAMNVSSVPSGDHFGCSSYVFGVLVRLVSDTNPSESRVATKRSRAEPPPEIRANANIVPSGDHAGSKSIVPLVRSCLPLPSAFTQASLESPVWKAIRVPSGDQTGLTPAL